MTLSCHYCSHNRAAAGGVGNRETCLHLAAIAVVAQLCCSLSCNWRPPFSSDFPSQKTAVINYLHKCPPSLCSEAVLISLPAPFGSLCFIVWKQKVCCSLLLKRGFMSILPASEKIHFCFSSCNGFLFNECNLTPVGRGGGGGGGFHALVVWQGITMAGRRIIGPVIFFSQIKCCTNC